MASTDTTPKDAKDAKDAGDLAGLEAGLDALETVQTTRKPFRQTLTQKVLPPVVAVALVLTVWQSLITFKVVDDPTKLPAPADVWQVVEKAWLQGELLGYIWTSVSRGLFGFCLALVIATPSASSSPGSS